MTMWDDVKKNLMEWYSVTTDKTVEVARVTSLRYDKFGISRDIERQFSELGNLVYTALKEGRQDVLADPRVGALVEKLDGLEQELKAKEEEIEKIRRQHREKPHREKAATVDDVPVVTPGQADETPDPEAQVQAPADVAAENPPAPPSEGVAETENKDRIDL